METTTTYLLISAVSALLLGILKIMYSSKCSKIKFFFGSVDIIRGIESKVEEDKYKTYFIEQSSQSRPIE